jgi:ribosomal-protein-alanine N-acetyltransferase
MLNHKGTITLETERLILRRFAMTDAEAMYANWCADPDVTKYLMWPTHGSIDESRKVLSADGTYRLLHRQGLVA